MDVEFDLEGETFRWDAEKAASNFAKHGIRFDQAAEAFFDIDFRLIDASRNDEARDAVIGADYDGVVLFVVHIEIEGDTIRIISARRATPQEREIYADS